MAVTTPVKIGKAAARAEHANLYRVCVHVHGPADFLDGISFHFLEHDHEALFRGQLGKEALDGLAGLGAFERCPARLFGHVVAEALLLFLAEIGLVDQLARAFFAQIVVGLVDGDLIEPGGEAGATVKTANGQEDFEKDLLANVFDIFTPTENSGDDAEDALLMGADELLEGRDVALLGPADAVGLVRARACGQPASGCDARLCDGQIHSVRWDAPGDAPVSGEWPGAADGKRGGRRDVCGPEPW